jgi:hypothetical protein
MILVSLNFLGSWIVVGYNSFFLIMKHVLKHIRDKKWTYMPYPVNLRRLLLRSCEKTI